MVASIVFQLLRNGEDPRTMVSTAYLDSSLGSYVDFLTCLYSFRFHHALDGRIIESCKIRQMRDGCV